MVDHERIQKETVSLSLPRTARGLHRVVLLSSRGPSSQPQHVVYYHVSAGRTGFITSPEFGSELETTDSGVAAFSSLEQLPVAILLACMLKMERERGKEISSKASRDCVIISTCKDSSSL